MRPFKMTSDKGLQPDLAAVLFVKRDNTTSGNGAWRLAWMVPGDTCFCYAEGECSAKLFRTRYSAVAYGEKTYGETAQKWKGNA